MKYSKHDQQNIAKLYDFRIVEWDPLELEDPDGYIIRHPDAKPLLNHLLYRFQMTHYTKPNKDKELEDVRAFHQKFNFIDSGHIPVHATKRKLNERAECMQEELDEFKAAIETQNLADQADALIDLVYFAKGTAVILGLPWEQLWDDVQRANISKERGITKRGHAFDVIKPEGWQAPNGMKLLTDAGYDRRQFESHGVINENLCTDDLRRIHFCDLSSDPAVKRIGRVIRNFEPEPEIVEPVQDMGIEEEICYGSTEAIVYSNVYVVEDSAPKSAIEQDFMKGAE